MAWRAPREAVREALRREKVPSAIGPQDEGWTLARLLVHGDAVLEPHGRALVHLLGDVARSLAAPGAVCRRTGQGGPRIVVCAGTGRVLQADLPPPEEGPVDHQPWLDLLRTLDQQDRVEAVLQALASGAGTGGSSGQDEGAGPTSGDRPRRVASAAGLPAALLDPDLPGEGNSSHEAVVIRRRDPGDSKVAASLVRRPLRFAETGDFTVLTAEPVADGVLLPVAVAVAYGRRPALLLWRQGQARGYQLVRRNRLQDAHVWGSSWDGTSLRLIPTSTSSLRTTSVTHSHLRSATRDYSRRHSESTARTLWPCARCCAGPPVRRC